MAFLFEEAHLALGAIPRRGTLTDKALTPDDGATDLFAQKEHDGQDDACLLYTSILAKFELRIEQCGAKFGFFLSKRCLVNLVSQLCRLKHDPLPL